MSEPVERGLDEAFGASTSVHDSNGRLVVTIRLVPLGRTAKKGPCAQRGSPLPAGRTAGTCTHCFGDFP
jgi:hypothetical protein